MGRGLRNEKHVDVSCGFVKRKQQKCRQTSILGVRYFELGQAEGTHMRPYTRYMEEEEEKERKVKTKKERKNNK